VTPGASFPSRRRDPVLPRGPKTGYSNRYQSTADVTADVNEVQTELVPVLRADRAPARRGVAAWADRLANGCRERLSLVLALNNQELEFLRLLKDEGEIAPELLTADPAMQATVREHPGLNWKALNVGFLRKT